MAPGSWSNCDSFGISVAAQSLLSHNWLWGNYKDRHTPERPQVTQQHREPWEGNPEMPTFYLSSVTSLSFFCLVFDYKLPTGETKKQCGSTGCSIRVSEDDKLSGFTWRHSPASPRAVRVNLQWEVDGLSTAFPTLLFLPYAEVREKQQTGVPNFAVFAYSYLLNNIFHGFLILSS